MFDDLREDLRRFGPKVRQQLAGVVASPGAWATINYRAAHWLHNAPVPGPFRPLTRAIATLMPNMSVIATSIQIPPAATIGPGLFIAHVGYIVMSNETRIGKNCTITQGVTLGHGGGGGTEHTRSPRVGDRVYIGPGAILIGDVEVGNDALIGAGAVVVHSVPARAVVVGNPARVISYKGSFDLIRYPGMESDPDRIASLQEQEKEQAQKRDELTA